MAEVEIEPNELKVGQISGYNNKNKKIKKERVKHNNIT